jgi:S-adenosylmethionine synthetase
MRNIVVEELKSIPIEEQKIEIVERKGVGHPDYICDSMMNQISIELSKEYLRRFGLIYHHNIDKSLLVAGEVEQKFGGGKVIKPMKMVIGDRATFFVGEEKIDVEGIVTKTAKEWIKNHLRFVDPEKDMVYQIELKPGSAALQDIFKRAFETKVFGANDTSAVVGYAPLTETEKLVLETEKFINSKDFKKRFPESGEDVKVMGVRKNGEIHLTIAMPLIDRFVKSEEDYFRKKDEILEEISKFVKERTRHKAFVYLNTLDRKGRGIDGVYLTVTGTCAENADCGQVGRGNRVNGLIPLNRPSGSEAAAGKNPVSHIGKIYNLLSYQIANRIYESVDAKEVYVWLVSQIGEPIDKPMIAAAQIITNETPIEEIKRKVEEIIDIELSNIHKFCMNLINNNVEVC